MLSSVQIITTQIITNYNDKLLVKINVSQVHFTKGYQTNLEIMLVNTGMILKQ